MQIKFLSENNGNFGAKFENLALLYKNGFLVPKTFVLNEKNIDFKKIKNLYKKYINSKFYIVRSSCNVEDGKKMSYAGLFLSIFGKISENLLEKNIKKIIENKNNENVILYEKYLLGKNLEKDMNIIVQEYIFGDFSGVYFSNLNGQKVLNIIYGGNKLLVDSKENSTNIFLNKNFEITKKEIGFQKNILTKNFEILEINKNIEIHENTLNLIIENIKKAEILFDFGVDIEFSIKKNKFYFLQLRPITI